MGLVQVIEVADLEGFIGRQGNLGKLVVVGTTHKLVVVNLDQHTIPVEVVNTLEVEAVNILMVEVTYIVLVSQEEATEVDIDIMVHHLELDQQAEPHSHTELVFNPY